MRFEGRIEKDGRHWVISLPALNAETQGDTRSEAYAMMKDLVETMADTRGFEATVHPHGRDRFELSANDIAMLVALLLRRQREASGMTLAQVAERLRQRSRNAYARYEQGRAVPTVEKLVELLDVVAPGRTFVWRLSS